MFELQQKIPSAAELKRMLPLDEHAKEVKARNDIALATAIATRERYIIVVGPCAADDYCAVTEYCLRLKQLNDKVKDNILLVPRIFTAKPRSMGDGYLGMLFCEQSDGDVNIERGLEDCRSLMINCLLQTELPIADEILYLEQYDYFNDLVSYYFLGARTSESSPHRNFASGMDCALGVKNNTSGNLKALAQALHVIENSRTTIIKGNQYVTSGNALAHAVLRGFTREGEYFNNCNNDTFASLALLRQEYGVKNNFVMVDCSHANSAKQPQRQIQNALTAVNNFYDQVGGLILESYLVEGSAEDVYGCSKTDACLNFDDTSKLILEINDILKSK